MKDKPRSNLYPVIPRHIFDTHVDTILNPALMRAKRLQVQMLLTDMHPNEMAGMGLDGFQTDAWSLAEPLDNEI